MSEKMRNLQYFAQRAVNTAWRIAQNEARSSHNPKGFEKHLEFTLRSRSVEMNRLLNEIAQEELNKVNVPPEPMNFDKFIRTSNQKFNHVEVFVGNKWVQVPSAANINFEGQSACNAGKVQSAFTVTISYKGETTTYTSSETYEQYQSKEFLASYQPLLVEGKNRRVQETELDWMRMGAQAYGVAHNTLGTLNNTKTLVENIPKPFKQKCVYKLSKTIPQAEKTFNTLEKLATKAKYLGRICNYLSFGVIGYEIITNNWDAHTAVNTTLLVVGIAATSFSAIPIVTGIAIYGLLDLVFDVGGGIDSLFGRKSGFWDNKAIESYPTDFTPLFNTVQVDNTYLDLPRIEPLKYKD